MTTTLAAPRTCRTRARMTYTLEVEGMAGEYRMDVEKLMLLLPDGDKGEVWFTRWQRRADRTYSCRETILATPAELQPFERALGELARDANFMASVTPRSYHGSHVH